LKSANSATVTRSEDQYQQTAFDARQEWVNLQQRITNTKQRLSLTRELESIQRDKWRNEVNRHQRGRTTMAQVLQFEEDYASAQAALLQIKAELLILSAQQKLFGS
jgi:outer membrane protein TolC